VAGKPENLTLKGQFKNKKIASEAGKKSVIAKREKKLITEFMLELLGRDITLVTEKGEKITKKGAAQLSSTLFNLGVSGDLGAIKHITDLTEGKPLQRTELSGDLDIPIKIEFVD